MPVSVGLFCLYTWSLLTLMHTGADTFSSRNGLWSARLGTLRLGFVGSKALSSNVKQPTVFSFILPNPKQFQEGVQASSESPHIVGLFCPYSTSLLLL